MKQERNMKNNSMWELLENGIVIKTFVSHTKAKNAYHWKVKEAEDDMLDLWYEIREIKVN